jgi:hypothetical protein
MGSAVAECSLQRTSIPATINSDAGSWGWEREAFAKKRGEVLPPADVATPAARLVQYRTGAPRLYFSCWRGSFSFVRSDARARAYH